MYIINVYKNTSNVHQHIITYCFETINEHIICLNEELGRFQEYNIL